MKRIVTLQDISCVGSRSITMALPVIATMGVECETLSTVILSTHTMFSNFTRKDLPDQIAPVVDAWGREGIGFGGIYTSYLASRSQCEQVYEFFDRLSTPDNPILVDLAIANNGKLHPALDEGFPITMAVVCGKANIIIPNLMEVALLIDMPYWTKYNQDYIRELLEKLLTLRCRTAVPTGVSYEPGRLDVKYLDRSGEHFSYFTRHCPWSYYGTGDLYSSVVIGGLMRGLGFSDALPPAADSVVTCIEYTTSSDNKRWYAVEFEPLTGWLCQMLIEWTTKQDIG